MDGNINNKYWKIIIFASQTIQNPLWSLLSFYFYLFWTGIFAMYEIALVSSSKARLETLVGKGNKRAKGVLKQLEEPEKFLSTIQIGITLIGIVSGAYGGATIADDVEPLFASFRE